MSAEHDRTFFDTFMLVLGILVVVTLGLIFLARNIANETSVVTHEEDPLNQAEVASRIAPVARVAVAGKDNSALNPPAAAPAAAAADLPGEDVYKQVCTMCHGAARGRCAEDGRQGCVGVRALRRASTRCTSTRSRASRARPATCRRRAVGPTCPTSRS